jgi:uncharacterized protein YjiS (DUF1127 family)
MLALPQRANIQEAAMTMLNSAPGYSATPRAIPTVFARFLKRVARLINAWVAAVIAHRERQANVVVLRSLSDRELLDMGLTRGEIGGYLDEAAKARLQMQQSKRS